MTSDYWAKIVRPEQVLPPGAKLVADPISRLQAILDPRAVAFAEVQFDAGADLRITRGLLADEAASFLRGLDVGLLTIDATGGVRGVHPLFEARGSRHSIGEAVAALVEDDDACERRKTLEELGVTGKLVEELDVGDDPRHINQIARAITDHLVGDAEITAPRVTSLAHVRHHLAI